MREGEPGVERRTRGEVEEAAATDAIDEAAELVIAAGGAMEAGGSRRLRQLGDVLVREGAREIASRSGGAPQRSH